MPALALGGSGRAQRIGLLGGSFNPAHGGHVQLAHEALKALRLDEVWLMVSPGNPLKVGHGDMAPFKQRLAWAQEVASPPRIRATDIEWKLGVRHTIRTLKRLKKLYPRTQFIWLMGADGLANFHKWKSWRQIADTVPIAVFNRPGADRRALQGRAATALRHRRCQPASLAMQPRQEKPGWTFISMQPNPISATALRRRQQPE
ncbi:nicotinate-nucleotide adenylyltransferase [Formicincola oecophyllae]|uniref:Probable nicotinate-nucleotide adenylyltransferase n=2 Tax=Formicincola oecophyllae TaxID=2558361 RepID=A0A4Y6UCZ8_9PROT|nr:nicotinate-nucleotide adenylyltransferase [Formicincola oecophyllae]